MYMFSAIQKKKGVIFNADIWWLDEFWQFECSASQWWAELMTWQTKKNPSCVRFSMFATTKTTITSSQRKMRKMELNSFAKNTRLHYLFIKDILSTTRALYCQYTHTHTSPRTLNKTTRAVLDMRMRASNCTFLIWLMHIKFVTHTLTTHHFIPCVVSIFVYSFIITYIYSLRLLSIVRQVFENR